MDCVDFVWCFGVGLLRQMFSVAWVMPHGSRVVCVNGLSPLEFDEIRSTTRTHPSPLFLPPFLKKRGPRAVSGCVARGLMHFQVRPFVILLLADHSG